MGDPFRIEGPAIINVSGGRTSALMLRRILDAHGGRLPAGVHVAFANTGRERPETLDFVAEFGVRWRVHVRWLERAPDEPCGFREVDLDTASRDGGPFASLIEERSFLPHHGARFCTQELKIEVARSFMRSCGYEHWTSAVGLRRDEPARVAKHREKNADEEDFDSVYPLHAARVRKADVMAFWRAQDFDLGLRWWESNCDGCFLKSAAILQRTERDAPGSLAWWAEQERRVGATFVKGRRYLQVIERAGRPPLPGMLTDEGDDVITPMACHCTDRRLPPKCTCNKRPGRGHTLLCALARDDARRAA